MPFTKIKGKTKFVEKTLAASQTVAKGDVLYANGSGAVIIADSTAGQLLGVAAKDYSSSASTQVISVEVPLEPTVEWEGPVEAGTFSAADIDTPCDLNTEDGLAIDTADKGHFWITGLVNSTTARGIFVAMNLYVDVATT